MNTILISVLKGAAVALLVVAPLWWLPIFLQRSIPDFWLAAMTLPPAMLGGYVAGRRALRPILSGLLTGIIVMLLIVSFTVQAGELWVVAAMIFLGSVFAVAGAYLAVITGHDASQQ